MAKVNSCNDGKKWLFNEVEVEEMIDVMNNSDMKARERSEALSKLQKSVDEQQSTIQSLKEENRKLKKILRKCANNWKQEIVERGKLEEENEHLKERVMILEKLISDVETSEGMSIDNLIDTEMIGDE